MAKLAFLLRSYAPDVAYARRLLDSFTRFNTDHIHMFCVVPTSDVSQFTSLASIDITITNDKDFEKHFVKSGKDGLSAGYINQEIVKLAFWETQLADNYFCVDSDAVFVRPFTQADFMASAETPFTVLVEDRELAVEPRYFTAHWKTRQASIKKIHDEIGIPDRILRTCHGHQVMSSAVLRSFKHEFLEPRGWVYADALRFSPLEFTWYNMWLQYSQEIPIFAREPLVKVFHHEGHHIEYILRGISLQDIARGFVAVVLNSNFHRLIDANDAGSLPLEMDKAKGLAPYLSYAETLSLVKQKLLKSFHRMRRSVSASPSTTD